MIDARLRSVTHPVLEVICGHRLDVRDAEHPTPDTRGYRGCSSVIPTFTAAPVGSAVSRSSIRRKVPSDHATVTPT
jgi:hypothetical protein